MKKLVSLILTLSLVLSLSAVSAFAANPIITSDGSDSKDVTGSYVAGGASTAVYSVDVTWGNMEFTYTGASEGVWNPQTHGYDGATTGTWSANTQGGNKITVTNHSNSSVTAALSYAPQSAYSDITGSFDKDTLELATAEGTAVDNAPTDTATLNLSGVLASTVTTSTKLGTVTISLG